ncbi:MAG TPA: hypothetical protein VK563_16085 [Puia sp.]|nr:hypothetical protein [Puia sp.]
MNKTLVTAALFLFFHQRVLSQEGLITCSSERSADNSFIIYSDSRAFVDYTVKLNFNTLTGYTTSLPTGFFFRTVTRGRTEVMKLTPRVNSNGSRMFNYTYRYFPGRAFSRPPDTNFVYLMPSTSGNALRIAKVSSLEERLGQKRTDEFHATGFTYKQGDTICASRAGIVYIATDDDKEGEKKQQAYTDKRNRIAIEHRDGTLGHYSILAPVQLLIAPGDWVIPGQPLAIFNKESDKYQVFMSVTWLDQRRLTDEKVDASAKPLPFFLEVPVLFYTGENDKEPLQIHKTYTVGHPKEVIGAELTKKEKKKLGL